MFDNLTLKELRLLVRKKFGSIPPDRLPAYEVDFDNLTREECIETLEHWRI